MPLPELPKQGPSWSQQKGVKNKAIRPAEQRFAVGVGLRLRPSEVLHSGWSFLATFLDLQGLGVMQRAYAKPPEAKEGEIHGTYICLKSSTGYLHPW